MLFKVLQRLKETTFSEKQFDRNIAHIGNKRKIVKISLFLKLIQVEKKEPDTVIPTSTTPELKDKTVSLKTQNLEQTETQHRCHDCYTSWSTEEGKRI
jgi:hypothetical protein